jgi:hypothetical protein
MDFAEYGDAELIKMWLAAEIAAGALEDGQYEPSEDEGEEIPF